MSSQLFVGICEGWFWSRSACCSSSTLCSSLDSGWICIHPAYILHLQVPWRLESSLYSTLSACPQWKLISNDGPLTNGRSSVYIRCYRGWLVKESGGTAATESISCSDGSRIVRFNLSPRCSLFDSSVKPLQFAIEVAWGLQAADPCVLPWGLGA